MSLPWTSDLPRRWWQEARLARKLKGWALIVAAVFRATAFAAPADGVSGHIAVPNLLGGIGTLLRDVLVRAFGVGAFVLCFALVLVGQGQLVARPAGSPIPRILGVFVAMFAVGALVQSAVPSRAFPGGEIPIGGTLGYVSFRALQAQLGLALFGLTMGAAALAGLVLLAEDWLAELTRGIRRRPLDADSERRSLEPEAGEQDEVFAGTNAGDADHPEPEANEPEELFEVESEPSTASEKPRPRVRAPAEEEHAAEAEEAWEWESEETFEDGSGDEPFAEESDESEESESLEAGALPFDGDDQTPEVEDVEPVAPRVRPQVRSETPAASDPLAVIRLDRGQGVKKRDRYPLPPLDLLAEPTTTEQRESDEVLQGKAGDLESVLADFGVEAQVTEIERGPVITRFDLELSRGTRISKVTGLADDLALALGVGRVRVAPVKGKSALGVEVPNPHRATVFLRDVAVATQPRLQKTAIPLYLGRDASGVPLVEDLSDTPHLLIAGRTGAGKSVFVNSLILSILLTKRPEDVRLIMIDPKKVELEVYQEVPHLLTPVESNSKRATKILEWAVDQMEERYELLAGCGVRHLVSYNKLSQKVRRERLARIYSEEILDHLPERMPYIIIIVDELADLMMASGKEVENAIARLAQKARAVGIHVVLATQRPSTDVITGLIKSNLPARIAFQTRTGIDSRTILDRYGAEKLLDKGDMLYLSSKSDDPKRIQGPFVSDEEVESIVAYLRETASPYYTQQLEQVGADGGALEQVAARDELFEQAVEVVMTTGQASASFLQRRMQVGYARASRLVDLMEEAGIVSEHRGSKAREIVISPEQWEEMRGSPKAG